MNYTGITITGRAGAGKTTLADALEDATGLGRGSFATYLKRDLAYLNCHKGDPGFREVAQAYGTEHARAKYGEDVWIERFIEVHNTLAGFIFDDARFPNEIARLRDAGHLTVRVMASELSRAYRLGGPCPDHPSETALDDDMQHDLYLTTDTGETPEDLARIVLAAFNREEDL